MKRLYAVVHCLIVLIISTKTTAARKPVTVPQYLLLSNKIASLRGGAGPLNAKHTAKVAALVLGAEGAFEALVPAKANEAFGLPSNPLDDFIVQRAGLVVLSVGFLVWELVVKDSRLTQAVGISTIPGIIGLLKPMVTGDLARLGFRADFQYVLLAFWSLVAYTCLTGNSYADAFVKAFAIANVGSGLSLFFFPKENINAFGGHLHTVNTATKVHLRAIGAAHAAAGIIVSCLLWRNGISVIKAVGYGWTALAIFIVNGLFVNKEFAELGLSREIVAFWLGFHLIVIATLAL